MNKSKLVSFFFIAAIVLFACDGKDVYIIARSTICEAANHAWVEYTPEREKLKPDQYYCADWIDRDLYQDWVDGKTDTNPFKNQDSAISKPEDQTPSLEECNAINSVAITIGEAEKASNGNCRYLVTYQSKSASKDVNLFFFDTHTNSSTGINQEWYRAATIFAGNEFTEYGTIFTSGDTSVTERVAIIYTPASCSWIESDPTSLDAIAQDLAVPCR